jgi:hypothetical protein
VLDEGEHPLVITAAHDDSEILRLALEDERPWPKVGGIRGCRTTINELVAVGQKIRGGDWKIEHVSSEDVKKGELKTSWVPPVAHPAIPVEQRGFAKEFVLQFFKTLHNGSWDVSDEFNQRFPDYKFMSTEEYMSKAWAGKP